jgi:hypothetical protein
MESSSKAEPEKKAVFSFYNGYLTVIYGLLVTDGLQCVVNFTSDPNKPNRWNSLNAFLFLGTFLVSLHFWYVCATVDDLSQDFYRVVAGGKEPRFDLLLLLDALVATAFAGIVLAMFHAVPPKDSRFFLLFLCAAGLSLLYDSVSRLSVLYARRVHHEERERNTIRRYGMKVTIWIDVDILFIIGSAAIYFSYPALHVRYPFALGGVFAVFAVLLLLMDVELLTFRRHAHQ